MNSQGIGTDIRRFLLRGNVFALATAVLVGTALFQLFYSTVEYVGIPFLRGIVDRQTEPGPAGPFFDPLYLNLNGYSLVWGEVVSLAATLGIAALVILAIKRRLVVQDEGEPEFDTEAEYATCPECLSFIPAAARRCAYCATPLPPTSEASRPSLGDSP